MCCQWLERTEQTAVTVNRTASLRATIIPYVLSQSNNWTVSSDTVYSSQIFRSAGDYLGKQSSGLFNNQIQGSLNSQL